MGDHNTIDYDLQSGSGAVSLGAGTGPGKTGTGFAVMYDVGTEKCYAQEPIQDVYIVAHHRKDAKGQLSEAGCKYQVCGKDGAKCVGTPKGPHPAVWYEWHPEAELSEQCLKRSASGHLEAFGPLDCTAMCSQAPFGGSTGKTQCHKVWTALQEQISEYEKEMAVYNSMFNDPEGALQAHYEGKGEGCAKHMSPGTSTPISEADKERCIDGTYGMSNPACKGTTTGAGDDADKLYNISDFKTIDKVSQTIADVANQQLATDVEKPIGDANTQLKEANDKYTSLSDAQKVSGSEMFDPGKGDSNWYDTYIQCKDNTCRTKQTTKLWVTLTKIETAKNNLDSAVDSAGNIVGTTGTDAESIERKAYKEALETYEKVILKFARNAYTVKCYFVEEQNLKEKLAKKKSVYAGLAKKYHILDADRIEELELKGLEAADAAAAMTIAELGTENAPPFFRDQCFLLSEMPWFSAYKVIEIEGKSELKRLPYVNSAGTAAEPDGKNACLQMDGEPFGFMNRLTQYPNYHEIANMKTSEIANLQPLVRLFKILTNDKGAERQLEIPFESYFTKNDLQLFRNKDSRGTGVGIQDFTFSYEADNPFAIKKSIKAKLTIFANNFTELLAARWIPTSAGLEEFKYVDLALKTGVSKSFSVGSLNPQQADVVIANLDKLKFRLKAVVGWNYRDAWKADNKSDAYELNTLSTGVRSALYDSFITLNLTPTVHEFDIDEQGRVKFIINYLAYVEDFFDQPAFNIFPNTSVKKTLLPTRAGRHSLEHETETARTLRDLKTQAFAAKCNSDQMSQLQDEQSEDIGVYRVESFRALMRLMQEKEKLRYINLTPDDVYTWRRRGPRWAGIQDVLQGKNIAGTKGGVQTVGAGTAIVSSEIKKQIDIMTIDKGDAKKTEKVKQRKLAALAATGADTQIQPLAFFYVSDLIDVILGGLSEKYGDSPNSVRSKIEALKDQPLSTHLNFQHKFAKEILEAKITRFKMMDTQLKKLRILLGPIELVNHNNYISMFPSLGDVPISVKYFIEWLSKKMSDRDEVYYSLPKFLNDLLNDLLRNILNDSRCFRNGAKQRTRINQAAATTYKEKNRSVLNGSTAVDEITGDIIKYRKTYSASSRINTSVYKEGSKSYPLPVLNIAASRGNPIQEGGIENEINYMIYYAGRSQPVEKMNGSESEDASRGIFHYAIGRDRGITKTIKLTKTDTTGLKELRFEQEGYDGLKQLREVFDVDIASYANVHAYPGSYIFIDPKGFSPNSKVGSDIFDLTQIGIGGYHMIIRSEHSFGPGYANSKIQAKWVASIHAKSVTTGPNGIKPASSPGDDKFCFEASDRAAQRENAAKKKQKAEARAAEAKARADNEGPTGVGFIDWCLGY